MSRVGKDIAIPLHVDLPMRPSLSALGATRRWDTKNTCVATVNRQLPLDTYQLRATDTDWSRGQGPDVTGPIGAILLLLTGRTAAVDHSPATERTPSAKRDPIRKGGRHRLPRAS